MAQFRTGKDQYAAPVDVSVVGTIAEGTGITSANRQAAILVGDFVKYTPATTTVNGYIEKSAVATATHIVAQCDTVLEGRHVPVEIRDYRTSLLVGATIAQAPVNNTVARKKVLLYPILDLSDIIPDADGLDVPA